MYRSSELSRTRNEPSGRSDNHIVASSQLNAPQYQSHCTVQQRHSINRPTNKVLVRWRDINYFNVRSITGGCQFKLIYCMVATDHTTSAELL